MASRRVILLTGATGFLGTQIARRLIADPTCTVVALVRAEDQVAAARRLERAWWEWPELVAAIGHQVEPCAGDVCSPWFGPDRSAIERLTHVIHTAAELRLDASVEELRVPNVEGTRHALDVARAARATGHFERFAYVSTAYVCGARQGPIAEESLSDQAGFATGYEQSKFEAESLVRAAQPDLDVSIFRPGMIVGDSTTGAVKTFNTIYVPLQLCLTGRLPLLPASRNLRLNIVPVDYVADCIAQLTFDPRASGLTFHLVPPAAKVPRAGELLDAVRAWAGQQLDARLPPTVFVDVPVPDVPGVPKALRMLRPYLHDRHEFQRDNLERLVSIDAPDWRTYLPNLLEYAVAHGFLHRTERTVHEQVLHRLTQKHHRVRYHDITSDGIVERAATDVRRDILAAVAALEALGIKQGDRVAIVGCNSSRYLALDVAIGLAGAVSVPLYSTSPPSEIASLLESSGARLLFIGAPGLLARVGELRTEIPMVAFTRTPPASPGPKQVIEWEQFLHLGAGTEPACGRDVRLTDLATLRFTSGTTGAPKAAAFDHASFRWMAETLAALLPWQARTHHAAYLSFLPMNHVVEGMLATYGAYYLPAAVDLYFLDDFYALPAALTTAQPTVFFSVPRVYEKLWSTLCADAPGRWYLTSPPGFKRRLLRFIVRRGLLRKAGLDRCAMLIVGSARVSEALLRNFQELGIDIHSAYGLTEAPLVTMNRDGRNHIGTVGAPLPETSVAIAADGEILVRGPQVMSGYHGRVEQPFKDGWLLTGDLGRLTSDGDLLIEGRKKDLIATAYGKKINLERVETLLRQIPAVTEAMLIGEARPFCAALLWTAPGASVASIQQGVEQVNRQLSHAEQIKRWTILPDELSVEGGELTPNLKLKRAVVAARFAEQIDALYAEAPAARIPA